MSAWNFTTQSAGAAFPSGYDNEDRFMNFVQSGQSKTSLMTRSNIGNISNVSLNGSTTSRSYSSVHELESVGGSSQSYDADGNLSTSLTGTSFDWDASGMMTTANVNGGPSVEYGYDANGKRIWKKVTDGGSVTETVFIHAGPNCIAEYAKGAAAASSGNEYIYAGGIDSLVMLSRSGASQNLAITRNQQWSVSALVSAGGSVVERYTYDLFGKRTILAANGTTVRPSSNYAMNYGYTSRRHETETGLMHFRARYYDANTGEFLSRDPLEFVDGMSQYRGYFVVKGVDPFGTDTILDPDSKCYAGCVKKLGAGAGSTVKELAACYKKCQEDRDIILDESCDGILNPVSICSGSPAFEAAYAQYKKQCKRSVLVRCGGSDNDYGDGVINVTHNGTTVTCNKLAHELLHAADACAVEPPKEDRDRCRWSACIEARANIFINCCHGPKSHGQKQDCFDKCIQTSKTIYVDRLRKRKSCEGVRTQDIERFWDHCAPADTEMRSVCDGPIPDIVFK